MQNDLPLNKVIVPFFIGVRSHLWATVKFVRYASGDRIPLHVAEVTGNWDSASAVVRAVPLQLSS